jgi:glycosyltransferase involved in cell wall biosynthesis
VTRPRVLLISHDPVGAEMAGLGIRTFELARVVADHADVTVAHGGRTAGEFRGVRLLPFRPHDPVALRAPIAEADVVVAHPVWPLIARWLRRSRARIVHDLYDPETLETLELFAGRRIVARRLLGDLTLDRLDDALRTGHHFMCASEKQRDLWLGAMLGRRRIDPQLYDRDPSMRSVIDTVPFGVPAEPPPAAPAGARGPRELLAAIGPDAELVLWNGGIWNWLDAPAAVAAVAELARRRPQVRLLFMGGASRAAADEATQRTRALAAELGVLDRVVLFHDGWVPYEERALWLAQADCAISTHTGHLEARFAFRTRMLDCFWSGLPIVCSAGDALADRVAGDDLGAVVQPGDRPALTAALERVLERGRAGYADGLRRAAADHAWPLAARPLVRWITEQGAPVLPGAGAVPRTVGQRARAAAYLLGGRRVLDRRARG